MNIGVLTSVDIRHRYLANRLLARFRVVAVGYEEPCYLSADVEVDELSGRERAIVAEHFLERTRQEKRFFGRGADWIHPRDGCAVRRITPGSLNTHGTVTFLESAGVDMVVVFGTNLIKAPLLSRWPLRMINMHLGLSPYYRGTATNFYPLLNEEPEYVGATIHLLDEGIDSGPILRHARPTIVADDRPHTIGCKAIEAGTAALLAVLAAYDAGAIDPVAPWAVPCPRLYLRKDYHPRQVVELYRKLAADLILRYVERARRVAPRVRLVD